MLRKGQGVAWESKFKQVSHVYNLMPGKGNVVSGPACLCQICFVGKEGPGLSSEAGPTS